MIDVTLLALLQGIAEFLPISSSGHLVLAKRLLGLGELGLRIDIFLHVGTLFAIFAFYWQIIRRIVVNLEWSYLLKIVLSAVPAGVVGVLFKDDLEAIFASPVMVGAALVFTGIVLTATRFLPKGGKDVSFGRALLMGVAQAVAILPGVSRSGMTLAAARASKVDAEKSAEFSFLMSAPPIAGAALLEVLKAAKASGSAAAEVSWPLTIYGGLLAGIVGYFALALLLKSLKGRWFWLFGPYCLVAGIVTMLVSSASAAPTEDDSRFIPTSTRARVLPRTVAVCQTENYLLSEWARGMIGRYVDQPLAVDPDISKKTRPGVRLPQAELELSQRDAQSYGFDGFASFFGGWITKGWLDASIHSSVRGFGGFTVTQKLDPKEHYDILALSITNPVGRVWGDRSLILSYWNRGPAYWSKQGVTPETMKGWLDVYRRDFGDKFLIVTDLPDAGRHDFRHEYELTGDLCEDSRAYLRRLFREDLRVVDGVSVGETHMLQRFDEEIRTRVHEPGYMRLVYGILREILDEPEFKGRKLLGMNVVNGHENAYTRGYNVSHNGTRTLRGILDLALELNPDVMKFGEWDEYNENTCFAPTLYNGTVTKRIVRSYLQRLRGEKPTPLEGDDLSQPNLCVSYRKSLASGEPLAVEVLSVADGSWTGPIEVSVAIRDSTGSLVKEFPWKTVSADRTSDYRFVMSTHPGWVLPQTVALRWRTPDGRHGEIAEGFHPIDLSPANAWNHKWVKQAIRDLAPMTKTGVKREGETIVATVASSEPIRYAMVCGGGEILYIHNPADRIDRFREDDTWAVFQTSFVSYRSVLPEKRNFTLELKGVPEAEWIMARDVVKGPRYRPGWLAMGTEPVYVRLPKAKMKTATLVARFGDVISGELPVQAAYDLGAYTIGAPGSSMVTLARLNRQASYPSVWNKNEAAFAFCPQPDRQSMAVFVQVVTMSGKEWRSQPFVFGKPSTSRTLDYDFSPACGEVVRPKNGERWFYGMLGGSFSVATLRNRGPATAAAFETEAFKNPAWDPRPRRERGADGAWELVFDGVDDCVGFPWETVPQNGPWEIAFDFKGDGEVTKPQFMGGAWFRNTGNLRGIYLRPDGSVRVAFIGRYCLGHYVTATTPKGAVRPNDWNRLTVSHNGQLLSVDVNGQRAAVPAPLPGSYTSTFILGGSPDEESRYRGRIRNFSVRQALGIR